MIKQDLFKLEKSCNWSVRIINHPSKQPVANVNSPLLNGITFLFSIR